MRAFDFNSFIDLSYVFDLRKGQIAVPLPAVSAEAMIATEPKARVILYSTTSLKAQLAHSRFVNLGALLPTAKPVFVTASARKVKPAVVEITPAAPAPVVQIPANDVSAAPAIGAEPKKTRTTLKLKTKVELPALQPLSRKSTTQDLAAAFKAEMALMEKKVVAEPSASKLEDAFTKRRRHPLSDKSWSELLAEVEMPKKSKHNFDLGAAFKAEMKAFMAEQERLGGEAPATLSFKSAAGQKISKTQAPAHRLAA